MSEQVYCGGDIIVFRPTREVNAIFSGYAYDCALSVFYKARLGRGYTVVHIYAAGLKNMKAILPPLPEQKAIADFLDRETTRIDELKVKIQNSIDKLKEYRSALITAAVIGKIDVRGESA